MMYFKKLVLSAVNHHASHLYLTPNNPPAVKKCGQIEFLKISSLNSIEIEEIIKTLLVNEQYRIYRSQGHFNVFIEFDEEYVLQIYLLSQEYNSEIIVHILEKKIYPLVELEISQQLHKIIYANRGLLLITGPTYNGKMTTMTSIINSIIDEINYHHKKHVLIFDHGQISHNKSHNSLMRKYALSQASFSFIKNQAADIIFFNDFHDINLIRTAINCIETGHLVIALIDSISLEYAIERLINLFSVRAEGLKLLSLHLSAIMIQVLVKKNNSFDSMCICDLITCNDNIQTLIKKDNLAQIGTKIVDKLTQLVDQGVIDYDSTKIILEQFGAISDTYDYDPNHNVF